MSDSKLERLERLARDRWGEEWAIEQRHWADGTTSEYAYHVRGPVARGDSEETIVERERLRIDDDGRYFVDRVRVRREEYLETELIDDPFDLVDESSISWSWVKVSSGRWHRVTAVDEPERTVECGRAFTETDIDEMATSDPSEPEYTDPIICERCQSADRD